MEITSNKSNLPEVKNSIPKSNIQRLDGRAMAVAGVFVMGNMMFLPDYVIFGSTMITAFLVYNKVVTKKLDTKYGKS